MLVAAFCAWWRWLHPRVYVVCEDPDQLGYWLEER